MTNIPSYSIKQMLESGVHFGHKKNKWNPQMSQFIYGAKGDLHIIDLTKTYTLLAKSLDVIANTAKNNGKILFVGTKKQSSAAIAKYASESKQHFVNFRWLGGMLTNWYTVSESITNLNKTEELLNNPESDLTKKEKLNLSRKFEKLNRSLGGIKNLNGKPSLLIIFDTNKEAIAVKEAAKLNIPIIAIVDTNSSLDHINYPIPGNDDSAKATSFFCELFAAAIINNRAIDEKIIEEKAESKSQEVKESIISVLDENKSKNNNSELSIDKEELSLDKKEDSAKEKLEDDTQEKKSKVSKGSKEPKKEKISNKKSEDKSK
jgi:small subunit ribosomal protein S2